MNLQNQLHSWLRSLGVALLVLCSGSVLAGSYHGHCDVKFDGDSTLHSFSGYVTNVPLLVLAQTNQSGEMLLSTRIELKATDLTTHNTKRDLNMYKMFKSGLFPKLLVVVTNAPLAEANLSGSTQEHGVLPVRFTFCGVTKEYRAVTSDAQLLAEGWEFDLNTEVSLKAFELKPPTAALGAISVHDLVKVKAHVKLQKEPP